MEFEMVPKWFLAVNIIFISFLTSLVLPSLPKVSIISAEQIHFSSGLCLNFLAENLL